MTRWIKFLWFLLVPIAIAAGQNGAFIRYTDDRSIFSLIQDGTTVLTFRNRVIPNSLSSTFGLALTATRIPDESFGGKVDVYENDDMIISVVDDTSVSENNNWISRIELKSDKYAIGKGLKVGDGIDAIPWGKNILDKNEVVLINRTANFLYNSGYSIRGETFDDPYDSVVVFYFTDKHISRIVLKLGAERVGYYD